MTEADAPLPPGIGPVGAHRLIAERFDEARVTGLRHAVASCAGQQGLSGQRLDDFVLAVNELLTNAVRHGGGHGHIQLWRDDAGVVCEVSDAGAGLAADRPANPDRPPLDTPGGWGLWLVERLTDAMHLRTGSEGTWVRIRSAIEPPDGTPGLAPPQP